MRARHEVGVTHRHVMRQVPAAALGRGRRSRGLGRGVLRKDTEDDEPPSHASGARPWPLAACSIQVGGGSSQGEG